MRDVKFIVRQILRKDPQTASSLAIILTPHSVIFKNFLTNCHFGIVKKREWTIFKNLSILGLAEQE